MPSALPERTNDLTALQQWVLDHSTEEWKETGGWTPPGHVNSRGLVTVFLSLQKKGLIEARRGRHSWEIKRAPTRCGYKYKRGVLPPAKARYALYFWGNVVFAMKKSAAENAKSRLPYYEQEDAQVVEL